MNASSKSRLALRSVVASVSAALLLGAIGCEGVESSETQASRKVAAASEKAATALELGDADAAHKAVGAVDNAAGAAAKAAAYAILAEADYTRAQPLLAELDAAQVRAATLAWQIDHLANRAQHASATAQAMQQRDPQDVRAVAAQTIKSIQGDASKSVWIEDAQGEGDIPTLTEVNQRISRLEGEIARRREQIAQLAEQRKKVGADAQALIEKSNTAPGQQGVAMFAEGAKLRQQANAIGIQIDGINAEMIPLANDLSRAQAEREVLQEAVNRLQEQDKTLAASWNDIGRQIDGQNELARTILTASGGGSAGGAGGAEDVPSVLARMQELQKLIEDSEKTREQAMRYLDDAARSAASAAQQAQTLGTALTNQSRTLTQSRPAFEAMQKTHDANAYRLQQLNILQTRATSLAHRAAMLGMAAAAQQRAGEIAQQAKITPPQGMIDPQLEASAKEAQAEAVAAFEETVNLATTVKDAGAASPEQRNAARVAGVIARYGWANAARAAGDAATADAQLAAARNEAAEAVNEKAVFPPMPAELEIPRAATPATPPEDAAPEPGAPAPGAPAPATAPQGAAPAAPGAPAAPAAPGGGGFGGAPGTPPAPAGGVAPPVENP